MTVPWCRKSGDGWLLELHVQPGARKSEIAGPHGSALKVRVASLPVDGRANDELVAFIANALDVPRQSVQVIKGQRSRRKIVRVSAGQCDPVRLIKPN